MRRLFARADRSLEAPPFFDGATSRRCLQTDTLGGWGCPAVSVSLSTATRPMSSFLIAELLRRLRIMDDLAANRSPASNEEVGELVNRIHEFTNLPSRYDT